MVSDALAEPASTHKYDHLLPPLGTTAGGLILNNQHKILHEATDVEMALKELRKTRAPVIRPFMIGKIGFTALYKIERHPSVVQIVITQNEDPSVCIRADFDTDIQKMHLISAEMQWLKNGGYYSLIVRQLLRGTRHLEGEVTNHEARHIRGYNFTDAHAAPDCVLKNETPLVGGLGNDFLCGLSKAATHVVCNRISGDLHVLIELAKGWYRDPQSVDLHDMCQAYADYKNSPEFKTLSDEIKNRFLLQMDYLQEQNDGINK